MSDVMHAPGPWRFEECQPHDVRLKRRHWKVGQVNAPALGVGLAFGEDEANARLIAAAPDLLKCQTMGAEVNTPDFLDWIAERIVHHYGESENVDFVLSLRQRAAAGRAAVAKATGAAQ